MAAFKVLAALLVVCVAQNVAHASFFDNKQDIFAVMETAEMFGVFSPVSKLVKCLPTLTDTYKWFQELKGYFRQYREINLKNQAAKQECSKLDGAQVSECLKKAEDAMVSAKVELFTKVDKFANNTFQGFVQFKECMKTPPSA